MTHGQKLHTFCAMSWPGKAIWNRDIDKSADAEILQTLSERTGTPYERVRATTLSAYEGVLYERYNRLGPAAWIMPVGVYHRTRRRFGLMYCPRCLADDREPYYRRRWRLPFMTVCDVHGAPLRDRCPRCATPVCFHRNELGDHKKFAAESLTLCHACGLDLREADDIASRAPGASSPSITPAEVEFTRELLRAVSTGFMQIGNTFKCHSILYFAGLRHLMKVLAMRNPRLDRLRREISIAYEVELYEPPSLPHPDVQELSVESRKRLLGLIRCLLAEWPHRFIELSQKCKVWSSIWLKHLEAYPRERLVPFWIWSVVYDHLYRARYQPSDEELQAAAAYLKRHGKVLNCSTLSRLIGVAVIRRRAL
jgi:hypothetical protein